MPRRPPFVPDLAQAAAAGPAFRAQDAAAVGYSRRALGGDRLLIPTRSIRSPAPLRDLQERAAAYALALPDDVAFSHLTAARAHGLPLPPRLARPDDALDVMRRTPKAAIERAGCCSHRGLERRTTTRVGGLVVTDVADTWCDLIEKHHADLSLADVVMMGDAAAEQIQPTRRAARELHPAAPPDSATWWTDPANRGVGLLRERVERRRRWRGSALAKAALTMIRPRVWSPMESHSRLVVVGGGIREPRLNATVRLSDGGGFLMVGDLVWDEEEVVGEYNGPTHEGTPSRQDDNAKRLLLEDQGWWLLEMYSRDIFTASGRHRLLHRIRKGLSRKRNPTRDGF
jgi:hypothetical protein